MKEKFNEKVIPVILKFINTKGIQSIKNGMVTSMSPLIIGSIFLILSNFPIKAVVDVLESTGIKACLLYTSLAYAIFLADANTDVDATNNMMSGLFQLSAYLLLMPLLVILASNLLFLSLIHICLAPYLRTCIVRVKEL